MNPGTEQLERLISRFLDDETSVGERRELNRLLEREPGARALFEEYSALDREAGYALRRALGRTLRLEVCGTFWSRTGRAALLAAAACVAGLLWFNAPPRGPQTGRTRSQQAAAVPTPGGSWFAPATPAGDVVEVARPADNRPHVRVRDTDRDWILIPGRHPGEFLLIQADRVKTRVVQIHKDF